MTLGWQFENRLVLCVWVLRNQRIPIYSRTNMTAALHGAVGGREESGFPGAWVASSRKCEKKGCARQSVSDPHPEERRLRSQDGYISQPSPPCMRRFQYKCLRHLWTYRNSTGQ